MAAAVATVVAWTIAGAVARAEGASASLTATPAAVVHGDPTVVEVALVTAPGCAGARAVEVQTRAPGTDAWATVAVITTDDAGAAPPLDLALDHHAEVRALVPGEDRGGVSCAAAASDPVAVTVAARVVFDPPVTTVDTGKCATLTALVTPPKPGDALHIQRRTVTGSWADIGTPALGDDSTASATWCFDGWGAIGTKTVRAWWPAQDDLNAEGTTPETPLQVTKSWWMRTIDAAAAGHGVSISVRESGRYLYRRFDLIQRPPASNEKLLLTMALLDLVPDPSVRLATRARSLDDHTDGVIQGDLWITGTGDPRVDNLTLNTLADRLVARGISEITGDVKGSTGYFARDWWAPGWRDYFPDDVIARPTALTYRGNWVAGETVPDPERYAAKHLAVRLRSLGVIVDGKARYGAPPTGLHGIAVVWSPPLETLLRSMNVDSRNFYAEVLGKLLSVKAGTAPGTIAGGAAAIEAFAAARGVTVTAYDGSGLSYANRATANGIARLLELAETEAWGATLLETLPGPGEGTLEDRLAGVPVVAKTGTLDGISALSGSVYLSKLGVWAEFSILGSGISKSTAVAIENKVVRLLWQYGK